MLIPFKVALLQKEKRFIVVKDEPISLYMEVHEKEWPRLQEFVSAYPEQFAEQFETVIINAISEEYPGKRRRFIDTLKRESGLLSEYFSYWQKRNFEEWPKFLQKLIMQAEETDLSMNKKPVDKEKQKHTIEYCIRRLHGSDLKRYKVSPFQAKKNPNDNHLENF